MTNEDRLEAEQAAYDEYAAAQQGAPPSKVRAARERWEQAVSALRAAGLSPGS